MWNAIHLARPPNSEQAVSLLCSHHSQKLFIQDLQKLVDLKVKNKN